MQGWGMVGNDWMAHRDSSRVVLWLSYMRGRKQCRSDVLICTFKKKLIDRCKMTQSPKHAIVYGASGLIGWALVDQLLSPYPHAGSFSKVTAVTNRPIDLAQSHWPESASDRPEIQLVSGIDLRNTDGPTLAESLKQVVKDVKNVTHIYYLGLLPI